MSDALYTCSDCGAPLPGDPVTAPGVCDCGGVPCWSHPGPEPDWLDYADLRTRAGEVEGGRAAE